MQPPMGLIEPNQENTVMNVSMLIGGADAAALDNRTFERRDPVTGDVATSAPAASVEDALKAARVAGEAYASWSKTGPAARRALLLKAADALETMAPEIAPTATAETAQPGPGSASTAGSEPACCAKRLR